VVVNDTNQSGTGSLGGPLTVSGSPFNHGLTTFDGQAVNDGDVLVKYTYYGDALLNGNVSAGDYVQIDNGFNMHLTGWYNGDFNYDSVINGDDYALIDNAYNTQGSVSFAGISAGPADMVASNTSQIAGESSSAVPEPGSLTLLTIGAGGLLSRRRRR
jgi:PEP-CTERM motif